MKISLAAWRKNAGLTQQQVADRLGVARMTVVNWERGDISKVQLYALAKLYDIEVEEITEWTN